MKKYLFSILLGYLDYFTSSGFISENMQAFLC